MRLEPTEKYDELVPWGLPPGRSSTARLNEAAGQQTPFLPPGADSAARRTDSTGMDNYDRAGLAARFGVLLRR